MTSPDRRAAAPAMFLFFSNRLGCAGSIALSLVLTGILLLLLRAI